MPNRTLGTGGRAKNGQFRRKSKFVPCAHCGLGTMFVLCVACAEKVEALKSHPGRKVAPAPGGKDAVERTALEVSEYIQFSLLDGWGK